MTRCPWCRCRRRCRGWFCSCRCHEREDEDVSDDETLARILRRALSRVDDEAFDGGMSYVYLGKREKFECDEDEIGPRLTLDGEVKLTDDEFEVVERVLAGRMRT